jgi:acetyl esterase/lipase
MNRCLAVFVVVALAGPAFGQIIERKRDVIYAKKMGYALTMDVATPAKAIGLGVVFCVSGGWVSRHEGIDGALTGFAKPLLDRGYTVFAVVHGSQPKFTIPEVLEDMHRAVRYIRAHAADFKIEPDRLGITGGSAGGHLSLMQGVGGLPGNPKATDPVERIASGVQCVGCFFPPTDFLNYGAEGKPANPGGEGVLKPFKAPFDYREIDKKTGAYERVTDPEKKKEIDKAISPVYHVTKSSAPTLLIHGDKDLLVPLQQSELMIAKLKEAGVPCELVVKPGKGHGWRGPEFEKDMATVADWFDKNLAKKE